MEVFTGSTYFLLKIFFLVMSASRLGFAQRNTFQSPGALLKCADFEDLRKLKNNGTFVDLPVNRTSNGIYSKGATKERIPFPLHTEMKLKCAGQQVEERIMLWDYPFSSGNDTVQGPRNFASVETGTTEPLQRAYFTSMGYFYDDITRTFYKPEGDYCIKSLSHDQMTINVCVLKDDCSKAPWPGTYCLPKCCAVDEVLSIPSKKCVPVRNLYQHVPTPGYNMDAGVTPWFPPIYSRSKNNYTQVSNVIRIVQYWREEPTMTEFDATSITFKMAALPKNCNAALLTGKMAPQQQLIFKWWSAEGVGKEPKANWKPQNNETVRLWVPSGGKSGLVRPMLYNAKSKTWEIPSMTNFCVDSVAGMFMENLRSQEYIYTGNDHNFAVISCETPSTNSGGGAGSVEKATRFINMLLLYFIWLLQ